jgi:hypothetical protein
VWCAQALPRLRALHTLEARDDDVGPAGVAPLAAALRSPACFRSLTRLHLGANPLSDAGVHALACALGGLPGSIFSSCSTAPGEGGGGGDAVGGGRSSTVDGISVTLLCGTRNTHSPSVGFHHRGLWNSTGGELQLEFRGD